MTVDELISQLEEHKHHGVDGAKCIVKIWDAESMKLAPVSGMIVQRHEIELCSDNMQDQDDEL